MSKPIYLTATAGVVHLVGEDITVSLTPDVAVRIAADLPKFAAQARILAGEELDVDYMASTLCLLGYIWQSRQSDRGVGQWIQSDSDPISPAEPFDRGTRRVFAEIVYGAAGPVL